MITSEIEARKTGHETKGILTAPYPFSWKALVRIPQTYCRFHNNYRTNGKTEEFLYVEGELYYRLWNCCTCLCSLIVQGKGLLLYRKGISLGEL